MLHAVSHTVQASLLGVHARGHPVGSMRSDALRDSVEKERFVIWECSVNHWMNIRAGNRSVAWANLRPQICCLGEVEDFVRNFERPSKGSNSST